MWKTVLSVACIAAACSAVMRLGGYEALMVCCLADGWGMLRVGRVRVLSRYALSYPHGWEVRKRIG